jgi:hypothetical protein
VIGILVAAISIAVLVDAPYPGIHAAQVVALRAHAQEPYFKYYCVAVNRGELRHPASEDALFRSTHLRPDPPTELILGLQDAKRRFVPASACDTDPYGDIRHRATKAKPSLLVVFGAVEVISPNRVRFMVFTTSGSLTETDALVEYERTAGLWRQISSKILRQS